MTILKTKMPKICRLYVKSGGRKRAYFFMKPPQNRADEIVNFYKICTIFTIFCIEFVLYCPIFQTKNSYISYFLIKKMSGSPISIFYFYFYSKGVR